MPRLSRKQKYINRKSRKHGGFGLIKRAFDYCDDNKRFETIYMTLKTYNSGIGVGNNENNQDISKTIDYLKNTINGQLHLWGCREISNFEEAYILLLKKKDQLFFSYNNNEDNNNYDTIRNSMNAASSQTTIVQKYLNKKLFDGNKLIIVKPTYSWGKITEDYEIMYYSPETKSGGKKSLSTSKKRKTANRRKSRKS